MFLARPLRDQCSSAPKGIQQSRARIICYSDAFAITLRRRQQLRTDR
jgi:hypothetical protein